MIRQENGQCPVFHEISGVCDIAFGKVIDPEYAFLKQSWEENAVVGIAVNLGRASDPFPIRKFPGIHGQASVSLACDLHEFKAVSDASYLIVVVHMKR